MAGSFMCILIHFFWETCLNLKYCQRNRKKIMFSVVFGGNRVMLIIGRSFLCVDTGTAVEPMVAIWRKKMGLALRQG